METKSDLSRKDIITRINLGLEALGAALFFPVNLSVAEAPSGKSNSAKNVVVIGAGLSGLAAALELTRAGHKVQVLEARNRPGGRVSTLKKPFSNGLYAEEGAAGFSETYTLANRYIKEFQLEKIPIPMPEAPVVYHLKGKRFLDKNDGKTNWPYQLSSEEQKLGPMGILKKYILDSLPKEISDVDVWDKPPMVEMDQQSLGSYMRNQGASEGAIELLKDTQWFGPQPENTSALSMAISDMGLFMSGAPFVLAGGNDSLPRAMAKRLEPDIIYGVEVKSISETGNGIVVKGKKDDKELMREADYVVCTIPASVLKTVEFNPPLPNDQKNAIKNIPYMDITRTYLQVKKPVWQEEKVAAMAITDLSTGHIFGHQSPSNGENRPALLENMVAGPKATKLARLPEEDLIQKVMDDMAKVYPGFQENFEKAHVKDWNKDPYALGAVSWPAPGEVVSYVKALGRPHGNVYFAGEHTQVLRSTMEGALRSGAQAARQIDEK